MRRDPNPTGGGAGNDEIIIGVAPFDSPEYTPFRRNLWLGAGAEPKAGGSVELGPEVFAAAHRAYAKDPQAFLDIFASDDTDFDFVTLLLVY
jgi:hypothetical protein